MQPSDVCYYECVTDIQITYLDLDLKSSDCISMPPKLVDDKWEMARQCLKLLEWGFRTILHKPFDLNMVTVGDSCGRKKISYHIMVYDGNHA